MVSPNTPVLVGVGQSSERLEAQGYRGLSPVELAAEATRLACEDALPHGKLVAAIDAIVGVRQFENATPGAVAPFGRSNNFPRSVARRMGANPARAVLEVSGGQAPQKLVGEFCAAIAAGEVKTALLVGSEAISTVRHLAGRDSKPDWSENVEGALEDRGFGLKGLMTHYHHMHKLIGAPYSYSLLENARRGRLGLAREDYVVKQMGELFARFSAVAAGNPHAAAPVAHSAEELATVNERNRMIADPYTRLLVAREQVNQGAAILITSVGEARRLGIAEHKWVYLHGYADLHERKLLERADLARSPAAILACQAALAAANIEIDRLDFFDLYSCFPIAVFNVLDGLGLGPGDPRGFTLTGGLPFFGGPGNNYSMHAIAAMVEALRRKPGAYGLVGANGGVMSKYSAGVYSTTPAPWKPCDCRPLQARIDAEQAPVTAYEADGWARIETYSIAYDQGRPSHAIIIGRLEQDDRRFLALTPEGDAETLQGMLARDPLGQRVLVRSFGFGNRYVFAAERLVELYPPKPKTLLESYEFFQVARRGHVLEITINRPEVRNCLHPPAHEELDQIIDAYLADDDLWVSILTGAGTEAFCAGNDLKYQASGKPLYAPKSGFAGLTRRTDRTKPLICAVNGVAMGGGVEICLAADLVVADERAQFALSEVRVGLIAGAGGVVRLPRQIPKKLAVEMLLTGRKIGAARAAELGIVNRLTRPGQALDGARALADEILESSPNAVRCSLELMLETAAFASENAAAAYRPKIFDELITSEDAAEGVAAFVQKRKPQWKNR